MSIFKKIKGLMGSKDELPQPCPAPQATERDDQVDGDVSVIGTQPVQNKPDPAPEEDVPVEEIEKTVASIPQRRGDYIFPPINLLNEAPESSLDNKDAYAEVMMTIIGALEELGIRTIPHEIHVGPVYTRYQITLAPGVTYQDVAQKHALLAQSLGVASIKAVPIDGEHELMGVVVPNEQPQAIVLRDIIESKAWGEARAEIPVVLGKDTTGKPLISDLHGLGHLLLVGPSGSGKTSFIQSALSGLLYHSGPDDLRFIIADSKILEYNMANALPHMLIPVVTEGQKLPGMLKWIAAEMECRYQIFGSVNVKNIVGFNARVARKREEQARAEALDAQMSREERAVIGHIERPHSNDAFEIPAKKFPYIICIIDDLLDFYDYANSDIEAVLEHLLRLSAATGIHLIISTDSSGEAELSSRIRQRLKAKLQMTYIPSAAESSSNRIGGFRFTPQGQAPVSNGRSEPGYIYIMRNDSLPENCFKIGLTRESPERRASELSSATGVPTGFEVVYYRETSDCRGSESAIHRELADCRVSRNREFFNCSLDLAIDTVNRHCEGFTEGSIGVEGHAPYSSEDEFMAIAEFLKAKNDPPCFAKEVQAQLDGNDYHADDGYASGDELLPEAIDVLRSTKRASTSMIQRRLRIGYNRAARLMEELEYRGIVGPENGEYPREILVDLDRSFTEEVPSQFDVADYDADDDYVSGDELLPDAIDVLRSTKRASTSMLQRRLRIGYNRAACLMQELEDRGIVGPENGSSPREILVDLDRM